MTKKEKSAFTLAEGGQSPLLYGDEGVAEGYSCVETKGHRVLHTSKNMYSHIIKKGFTLAEVLITLGVIGVVAVVTMPILIQKVEERILISQLKQAYAMLNTATRMIVAKEGDLKYLDVGTQNSYAGAEKVKKLYEPYLKISKDCGRSAGCFPQVEYALDGSTPYVWQPNTHSLYYKIRLENGMSLGFWSGGNGAWYFFIDINGDKKPNTAGKDYFSFATRTATNSIRPFGERGRVSSYGEFCDKNSHSSYNGLFCTARVLEREKFDYSPW